jgi:pilus assembly protein Flp/PilA
MRSHFSRFLHNEIGATSVEYSLLAALIGVVSIVALTKLGTNLSRKFIVIANAVT